MPPKRKKENDNILTTDDFDGMSTEEIKMRLKKLMKTHEAVYPKKKESKESVSKTRFKIKEEQEEEEEEDSEISEYTEKYCSDSE